MTQMNRSFKINSLKKFIYSERDDKMERNLQILFEIIGSVKKSHYFVAFSEYMNFINVLIFQISRENTKLHEL